jgi:hypothetical protein
LSHGSIAQLWLSEVTPQSFPPCRACIFTWRILSMMPPPHLALHEVQPDHSSISQSIGHFCVLQLRCMVKGGQAAPLSLGTTT